jgi:hypothetical protein
MAGGFDPSGGSGPAPNSGDGIPADLLNWCSIEIRSFFWIDIPTISSGPFALYLRQMQVLCACRARAVRKLTVSKKLQFGCVKVGVA